LAKKVRFLPEFMYFCLKKDIFNENKSLKILGLTLTTVGSDTDIQNFYSKATPRDQFYTVVYCPQGGVQFELQNIFLIVG